MTSAVLFASNCQHTPTGKPNPFIITSLQQILASNLIERNSNYVGEVP